MQNDQTAARYEYKVLELREKLIGGKLSGDQLEKVLNDHAAEGWQLKAPDQSRGRAQFIDDLVYLRTTDRLAVHAQAITTVRSCRWSRV